MSARQPQGPSKSKVAIRTTTPQTSTVRAPAPRTTTNPTPIAAGDRNSNASSSASSLSRRPVVVYKQGVTEPVEETHVEYQLVANIVHRVLSLLNTEKGHEALETLAAKIFDNLPDQKKALAHKAKKDDKKVLHKNIAVFRRKITQTFPAIHLEKLDNNEAKSRLSSWVTVQDFSFDPEQDYNPRLAGRMVLNEQIVRNLYNSTGQSHPIREDKFIFTFQLIVAVLHEVGHFLTNFVVGDESNTPPQVAPRGHVDRAGLGRGEAGGKLEEYLLQGIAKFRYDPRRQITGGKIDPHQPGIPIFYKGKNDQAGRYYKVDQAYMERFYYSPNLPRPPGVVTHLRATKDILAPIEADKNGGKAYVLPDGAGSMNDLRSAVPLDQRRRSTPDHPFFVPVPSAVWNPPPPKDKDCRIQ